MVHWARATPQMVPLEQDLVGVSLQMVPLEQEREWEQVGATLQMVQLEQTAPRLQTGRRLGPEALLALPWPMPRHKQQLVVSRTWALAELVVPVQVLKELQRAWWAQRPAPGPTAAGAKALVLALQPGREQLRSVAQQPALRQLALWAPRVLLVLLEPVWLLASQTWLSQSELQVMGQEGSLLSAQQDASMGHSPEPAPEHEALVRLCLQAAARAPP